MEDDGYAEPDDGEKQKWKDQQPGDRGSRRYEWSCEGESEEADEKASCRHEESFLQLNAAVPNRERFEKEVHRAPVDNAAGAPVEQMNDDRNEDSESTDEQSCIEEEHGRERGAL